MKKTAVIVETRKHKALEFVLNNVMTILPPDWNLQIFHGLNNLQYINNIVESNNLLTSIKEKISFTNLNIESVTQEASSEIMLSEQFWSSINGDIILYFECDSMLCPNSKYKVDDFLDFDYIGGYWGNKLYDLNEQYPVVMNGGVSIRKKQFMLDIIRNKWEPYVANGGNTCEDYFVSACIEKHPTVKQVITFSIDCGYIAPLNMEAPFAVHKPWGVNPAKGHGKAYDQIKQVCNEIEVLKNLQGEYNV
tara:strand:- start:879 stop:1625 length:747 start_codon:yes stop_codon:yes gene_type:complete